MRNFELLASGIDVAPLIELLDAAPELWAQITARQDLPGGSHADTDCIFVRGPDELTLDSYFYGTSARDYPAMDVLQDALIPIMRPILTDVLGVTELGRVLIVRLKPGGHVGEHIDEGVYADHFSRFHIAITGEAGSELTADGEVQHFAPGEAWWFDHKSLHSADNKADTPRIHIIFDAVTPRYRVRVSE